MMICKQCEDCRHVEWNNWCGNNCDKYPNGKPEEVVNKEAECSKYERARNWVELHKGERMGKNTKEYCPKCKGCKLIGKHEYYSGCCDKYPNPGDKPDEIINEGAECKFYEKE